MITVLTPSYNRCHTLERLWRSLCAQFGGDGFEWVLVDDGSTDGTKQWFDSLAHGERFQASYVYQHNQGKHVALNTGAQVAAGQWCIIVDSDDALIQDAIAQLEAAVENVTLTNSFVGVCYRRQTFAGDLIGAHVPGDSIEMTPNEAGELFRGDLAYMFRTSVLQANPFPVIAGEKFVPELLVWNRIADSGKIRFFPEKAIYLCEYLPDGYSANFKTMLRQNPAGFWLFYRDQIKRFPLGVAWLKALVRLAQCGLYRLRRP